MNIDKYSSILQQRLIKNARLAMEPFPYLWIENFLPEEIYLKITTELKSFSSEGRINYEKKSLGIELYDPPETEVFNELKAALKATPFCDTIFSYFNTKPFSKFDVTLNRDFVSEFIGPHLDTNPQRLSFQIYLPIDNSQENQGTIIGTQENGVFKQVTQLKFLPNCAFAFLSGDHSWHSIPTFNNPLTKPRNSLLYRWKMQKTI